MVDISVAGHLVAAAAAVAAGMINAIAGGGTLVSFPALTAIGIPAVSANATNSVSLCPGYIGGAWAQRRDLADAGSQTRRLIVCAFGGFLGSILLILSPEDTFRELIPYLILLASVVLAAQVRLRRWIFAHSSDKPHASLEVVAIGVVAIYGGYFGAGLGIMLIAILGLLADEPLPRVNAIKQLLSIAINVCAASFLVFSGKVEWTIVAVMSPGALLGGNVGGKLAHRIPAGYLRAGVVTYGVVVAVVYFLR